MIVNYPTYNESCTLELTLFSDKNSEFHLLVEDANDSNIVFTNRTGKLSGSKKYYVRLPIAPDEALIVDGQVDPTPARISQQTGIIEVSKKDFLEYTIPMRMAILLHEFAHFYLNEIMEDEIEADKHSLNIYMALGYPRIDAYNVYLDVFANAPTELNKDRYAEFNKLFSNNYTQ